MNSQSPKVGIVGLGEAGNLGDDLILIATVDAIYEADPGSAISFLSFGQELDWSKLAKERGYPSTPLRVLAKAEIPLLRQNSTLYRDRDIIIFGGGGLIQTSHDKNRPYNWLSYLPKTGQDAPYIVATGLGMGPISEVWKRRLRRMGTPFDSAWLRDSDSVVLSREGLEWPGEECRDFIDNHFISSLSLPGVNRRAETGRLGVALRAWPNFSVDDAVEHIESVIHRHECEEVVLFVLESNKGRGTDVDFNEKIAQQLSLMARVHAYEAHELIEFLDDMSNVDLAISMKLHSSAIWATMGVPMYPVFYAPKVAALFGRKYEGFEVLDEIVQIRTEVEDVPRAHQTVIDDLGNLKKKRDAGGSRFSMKAKFYYQSANLIRAVVSRIRLGMSIKKRVAG
ncbi:polysaccharide pyruvyl transferase family protein [Paeniglutamicibacter antarcticus]|uniref:Polysaccharide pyruvyl transferase domain-containing protein n=1 Tax=Paeniglutamicibacter antarcticus TaxID=494023 RepID=A0ABP9TNF8_9MICC